MTEEINVEVIKKTQKSLGKYVKKPPLTEKLLKKPPFRFLHDVIHTVVEETGYLSGLFSEDELVSDNVKDKDAKILFLDKIIEAVRITTKTKLNVRSSKIVAGLEPINTNLLLQTIAKAIDQKIDSSVYVAQLKSEDLKKIKKSSTLKEGKYKSSNKEKSIKVDKEIASKLGTSDVTTPKQKKSETPKLLKPGLEAPRTKKLSSSRDSSRNKASSKTKEKGDASQKVLEAKNLAKDEIISKENNEEEKINQEETIIDNCNDMNKGETNNFDKPVSQKSLNEDIDKKSEIKIDETSLAGENFQNNLSSMRPKSAKPKSGDKILKIRELSDQEDQPKTLDNNATNSVRPRSSLRPPSVRPSSARPGAPRLRPESALPLQETIAMGNINVIVENIDSVDDEETVIIETATELPKETPSNLDVSGDNRGQLVEQILEQIQDEEGSKKRVDIDWDADTFRNEDAAYKEVHQLRTYIQNLTRTANPLGKLLNYLHEDIDAMHGELQMWINTRKQLSEEIQKQKKLSVEANKPLLAHLTQLGQEINKVKQEIVMAQSNILKNDARIQELLSK